MYEDYVGKFGLGERDSQGDRMFRAENLVISNILFKLPKRLCKIW